MASSHGDEVVVASYGEEAIKKIIKSENCNLLSTY